MLYQCLRRCAIEEYVSIMKQMQYPAQEQSLLLRLKNVNQLRLWRNITLKDMGLYLEYPSIIYMLKNIARQFQFQLWILHTSSCTGLTNPKHIYHKFRDSEKVWTEFAKSKCGLGARNVAIQVELLLSNFRLLYICESSITFFFSWWLGIHLQAISPLNVKILWSSINRKSWSWI